MPKKIKDLTGMRFGSLTAVSFAGYRQETRQKVSCWLCRCDCGTVKSIIALRDLRSGKVTSCGCDRAVKAVKKEFPEQVMDESKEEVIQRWMNQMREQYITHPKGSPMTEGTLRNILPPLYGKAKPAA